MDHAELNEIVCKTLSNLLSNSPNSAQANISPASTIDMLLAGTNQHALSNHLARLDNPNIQLQDDRTRYNRTAIDLLLAYYRLQLPPSLQELLQSELDAGNTVREVYKGWPKESSIYIKFANPITASIPDWMEFREINSPHWWRAEIYDTRTGHLFAW